MFNRKIAIFLLLAIVSTLCIARDVADYKLLDNREDASFLLGEPIPITADDGTLFYIQQRSRDYSFKDLFRRFPSLPPVRGPKGPYDGPGPIGHAISGEIFAPPIPAKERIPYNKSVSYVLLCEDKTHILYAFYHLKDFFSNHKDNYTLTITKAQDYKRFISYNFNFISICPDGTTDIYKRPIKELVIDQTVWVDKDEGKFCGSTAYQPLNITEFYADYDAYQSHKIYDEFVIEIYNRYEEPDFKEYLKQKYDVPELQDYLEKNYAADVAVLTRLKEYVIAVSDIYIEYIENDIKRYDITDRYELISDNKLVALYLRLLDFADIANAKELNTEWEQAKMALEEDANNFKKTKYTILTRYTTYFDKITYIADEKAKELKLKRRLPTTEDELSKYLIWLDFFYAPNNNRLDIYGVEIKVEIIPNIGIKATSAGYDKIFGTADDIVFVREYY